MYDALQIFADGSWEKDRLGKAAGLLTKLSPKGLTYAVEDTYFDYGQNWRYTTLIATNPAERPGSVLGRWQAFTPREQSELLSVPENQVEAWCEAWTKKKNEAA